MAHKDNKAKEEIKDEIRKRGEEKEKSQPEAEPKKQPEPKEEMIMLTPKEFDDIKKQLAKSINDYNELEHDFDNYRKRSMENIQSAKLDGIKKALETVLPALDTFKKARQLVVDEASLSGINLIEKSIFTTLEKLGVKKIECVGKTFDPNIHNAVLMIEDKTKKSGTIVEELEMGYKMGETILKYSQVVVAK